MKESLDNVKRWKNKCEGVDLHVSNYFLDQHKMEKKKDCKESILMNIHITNKRSLSVYRL